MLPPTEIGRRISDRRKELGLTLQDVADRVGVQNSTIYRYEQGAINKPKLPVIEAIAAALQLNPAWLIGKADEKPFSGEGGLALIKKSPPWKSDKAIKIVCQIDSTLYNQLCVLADKNNRSFENEMEHLLCLAVQDEIEKKSKHTIEATMRYHHIKIAGRDGSFEERTTTSEDFDNDMAAQNARPVPDGEL